MKVLIGVDDSPCSEAAVDHVVRGTWAKGTGFLVLSAAAPIILGPGETASPDPITRLMEEQKKYHHEIANSAAMRLAKAGLAVEARSMVGDPRSALVDTARREHAGLIVVGSHGRTGVKKLLLGSVASHVVTHAPCSVLVVREEGKQP